ncbi:ABC transporter permease [Haloarchaeobius sp. HME9146]|uniref:ABC transporter permease n=1 Tax=Haloarchaeobius sp. HME9146 TaxID=2978732 RepID=UPI0021C006DB|nr:ABC transporter permease [Haloarchaeobius sp. HME9146]MCT9096534.1 ABC transporter permease [Haloarchaeobius sp. HME9146]
MSRLAFIGRRLGFSILAAYAVMTVSFFVVAVMPDPNVGLAAWTAKGDPDEAANAVVEAKNLNDPLLDRYLQWVVDLTTFDWGRSIGGFGRPGEPVIELLQSVIPVTLAYLVPALLISTTLALALGSYVALNPESRVATSISSVGYLGLGVPSFFVAELLLFAANEQFDWLTVAFPRRIDLVDPVSLWPYLIPATVLATGLAAGQLRYVRAESSELLGRDFVKLVESKGAGDLRVIRHVLANAALPLLSLFFADMVSTMVVQVFVIEFVFGLQGIGTLTLQAVSDRNMPVIIGTTMAIAYAGIGANFLQDVAYAWFDPRADFE